MTLFGEDLFDGRFGGTFLVHVQPDRNDPRGRFFDGSPAGTGIDGDSGFRQEAGRGGADSAAATGQEDDFYFHNSERLI